MKLPTMFLFFLFSTSSIASPFPNEEVRLRIFDKVVSEMERIDGEGLPPRKNRPESWKDTVSKLRNQAKIASNQIEYGQVFRKLDATYPNLHAKLTLSPTYDIAPDRLRPKISVRFRANEILRSMKKNITYNVAKIETEMLTTLKEWQRPAIGDELLAINGRPMTEWSKENFIYCKFPMKEQCEANFFDHFRQGLLSWDWRSSLEYTLKRNDRTWTVKIPFEIPPSGTQSASSSNDLSENQCQVEDWRYGDHFKPVFKGLNVCALESTAYPNVTVLRITSFRYRGLPKQFKIQTLKDEVDHFYNGYWKEKAPTTKKLIIDVIDNGGGDTPIEWYKLFYEKPFQEQYVQFKKTPEIENDQIRKEMFYADTSKEIWFSQLKESGKYSRISYGKFLPQIPQFCADDNLSCEKGLHEPLAHGFKGQVKILVNEWCISTCTGFVWSMRDQLGKRVKLIGVPDSGDSAYARLFLDVYLDEKNTDGFRTEIIPRPGRTQQELPEGAILRQQITATRSTDSKGKVISATPSMVDLWIPYPYEDHEEAWEEKVFKKALKD